MPKVNKYSFSLDGKPYDLPIYYAKKDQRFRVEGMPSILSKVDCPDRIYADTEGELNSKIRVFLDAYKDLNETRRFVIIYRWHAMARKYEPGKPRALHTILWQRNWFRSRYGGFGAPRDVRTALGLNWRVATEITNPIKGTYFIRGINANRETHDSVDREESMIPWTLEAEQFFTEFEEYLKDGIKRMDDFLALDPEILELRITEASGLLPFRPDEVDL